MSEANTAIDLHALENRVDELVAMVQKLKSENNTLKSVQGNLMTERAILTEKVEQARVRVEGMIARLRAMENN